MSDLYLKPGQQFSTSELNRLRQQAQPTGSSGVGAVAGSSGVGLMVSPHVHDPVLIRHSFMARIVDKGPKGERDYTDSRYWVKQVYCHGVGSHEDRMEFTREGNLPDDGRRLWTTAVNLAEYHVTDRGLDSHALGLAPDSNWDQSPLVACYMLQQDDRLGRFWFYSPLPAVDQLCLLRGVDEQNRTLIVQLVQYDRSQNLWKPQGDLLEVMGRPGTTLDDFRSYATQSQTIEPWTRVFDLTFRSGVWIVNTGPLFAPVTVDGQSDTRITDAVVVQA